MNQAFVSAFRFAMSYRRDGGSRVRSRKLSCFREGKKERARSRVSQRWVKNNSIQVSEDAVRRTSRNPYTNFENTYSTHSGE